MGTVAPVPPLPHRRPPIRQSLFDSLASYRTIRIDDNNRESIIISSSNNNNMAPQRQRQQSNSRNNNKEEPGGKLKEEEEDVVAWNKNKNHNNNNHQEREGVRQSSPQTAGIAGTEPTTETVYQFYCQQLYPAIVSSLPLLARRLSSDSVQWLQNAIIGLGQFIVPKGLWIHASTGIVDINEFPATTTTTQAAVQAVYQYVQQQARKHTDLSAAATASRIASQTALAQFMLKHFDTNGDGHISSAELLNMTELFNVLSQHVPITGSSSNNNSETPQSAMTFVSSVIAAWWTWFSREWPLMDWKLGLFLWRTFGGLLIVLAVCSMIPGRLHAMSARVLRWPVLGVTYFLIWVELCVYTVIRLSIRLAEYTVARPKHRRLRRAMATAETYVEWYTYAAELDHSQQRHRWLQPVTAARQQPQQHTNKKKNKSKSTKNCTTDASLDSSDNGKSLHMDGIDSAATTTDMVSNSRNYNWALIRELIHALRSARHKQDSLLALAVIQQCTRKNVGGIMSEDLFSYSNTGEPKSIVREFIDEVVTTLEWLTVEALTITPSQHPTSATPITDANGTSNPAVVVEQCESEPPPANTTIARDGGTNVLNVAAQDDDDVKLVYEEQLQSKVRDEKDKLWRSLMDATIHLLDPITGHHHHHDSNGQQQQTQQPNDSCTPSKQSLPGEPSFHQTSALALQSPSHPPPATAASDASRSDSPQGDTSILPSSLLLLLPPSPLLVTEPAATTVTVASSTAATLPKVSLPPFHRNQVLSFLKRARAAYGRTALCLSGGAMMGLYHFGHILGLLEVGLLPHIISGTSAGAVVGAVVCTRTNDEIRRDLRPEVLVQHLTCFQRPWSERLKSVWKNGNMFDFDDWIKLIRWFTCGDMTFEEAYRKTGRVFCITLSSTTKKAPPVLLNYLTAPNVTIASAVIASAAVPGFVPPVRLQYKDADGVVRRQGGQQDETFFDGSIEQDIPINGLAEILNCQFFIACQANPHIVPFFYSPRGRVGRPSRWVSGTQESSWRGGFLLAALEMYLKNDMKAKLVFLKEVDAAVGFTSTMMTQEFVGSTTLVPDVAFQDYFKLFSDPKLNDLYRYFQAGAVAVYEHTAMIKLHYSIADTLDQCISRLETGNRRMVVRPRPKFFISDVKKPKEPRIPRRLPLPAHVLAHFLNTETTTDHRDGSSLSSSWFNNNSSKGSDTVQRQEQQQEQQQQQQRKDSRHSFEEEAQENSTQDDSDDEDDEYQRDWFSQGTAR